MHMCCNSGLPCIAVLTAALCTSRLAGVFGAIICLGILVFRQQQQSIPQTDCCKLHAGYWNGCWLSLTLKNKPGLKSIRTTGSRKVHLSANIFSLKRIHLAVMLALFYTRNNWIPAFIDICWLALISAWNGKQLDVLKKSDVTAWEM